jgi:hypothetical protein
MTGIVAQNVGRTSGLIKSAGGGGGVWTKIKEITASSDSDISFVDGTDDVVLDSTYPIYVFKFINLHPSNDDVKIGFQGSTDTGSSYGVTLTSTVFLAYHDESDSGTALTQSTTRDEAQSSSFQDIIDDLGNDNDQSASGELWLFSPSSTTYVKHWVSTIQIYNSGNNSVIFKTGGYFNTTSAIDAIQFKCTEGSGGAGNIDAGKIKLYGLGDS